MLNLHKKKLITMLLVFQSVSHSETCFKQASLIKYLFAFYFPLDLVVEQSFAADVIHAANRSSHVT